MQPFDFDMQIHANSQEEATRKANAAGTLIKQLSVVELEKLAHIVLHDERKLSWARSFLAGVKY